MNLWATLSLLSAFASFSLLIYIYNFDIKSILNKIFFFILVICVIWTFSEFQYRITDNVYIAKVWTGIAKIWIFNIPLTIHFIFIFLEKKEILRTPFFYFFMYLPALILYFLDIFNIPFGGLTKEYWGFSYMAPGNFAAYIIYLLWTFSMSVFACLVCVYYLVKRRESKIFIMLIAVFLPLFAGATTEVALPLLKIKIPELTGASFIISAALITYLIYKYRLFIPGIEKTTETILLTMSDALFILSLDFKIKRINNATKDMFGYNETDLYEKNINSIFVDRENEYLEKTINYCLNNDCIVKDEETFFITRYMEKIPVSFSCSTIKDKNKKKIGILLIVRDITKRKQMEEKINLSNESFINIVEKSTEGVIVLDKFYNILFINPIASRYLGLSQENDVSEFPYDVEENKTFEIEIVLEDNNRGVGEVVTIKTFWGKGEAYILTIRDITKRKAIEENLKKSLKEKEAMLSEVHHRIKNNLQIVMSLLKLPQRFYTENNFLENILIDSQNRIKSMALIHEKLYNNREFFSINMKDYITDLIGALLLSYDIGDKIKIDLDIEDIVLNIDNAVSCGLIINELFTNSIKYAFKESKKDKNLVRIKFSKNGSENLLIYGDNGKGLDDEKIDEDSKSIGFYLINLLIKKRLKGDFKYLSKNGLEYKITFNVRS